MTVARRLPVPARALEDMLALMLVGSLLVGFANLVARAVWGRGLFWAEDLQIYGLIGITFLGAAAVARRGAHLTLPSWHGGRDAPSWFRRLRGFGLALPCLVVGVVSARYAWRLLNSGQTSTVGIPLWIPNALITIGLLAAGAVALASASRSGGDA